MTKNKTLLISGGSSGLGLEIIKQFIEKAWRVILLSRDSNHILITNSNLIIIKCPHNIDGIKQIENKLFSYLEEGIDLLINNAGYGVAGALEAISDVQMLEQMQVNFFSHIYLTKLVLPYLRKKQGKIFNISSIFGTFGCPFNSMYCASKHAMEGFSESLYYELKPQQIYCSIIVPGGYHTNFAKNLNIAKTTEDLNVIYDKQYQNFYKLRQALSRRKANDPKNFAAKLYKLAIKNKLPPRISIDFDCKAPHLLRKYLPTKLFLYIQNLIYDKCFNKKLDL